MRSKRLQLETEPGKAREFMFDAVYGPTATNHDVYDDVDEDRYQELVSKRREDNFIEDDGACALSQAVAARAMLPLPPPCCR